MSYKNKTGFYRVSKIHDPFYKKGYYFEYKAKNYHKSSVDLFKLKNNIEKDGYEWKVTNENAVLTLKDEVKGDDTMNEEIEEILNIVIEMVCVTNKLSRYEDGESADYSDVITDLKWNLMVLNNRLSDLSKK